MTIRALPLLIILGLTACKRPSGERSSAAPPPVPVEVATARLETIPIELHAIGTVEPIASVQLKAKVAGEILKVNFADGASVKIGDPLFEIDPSSYQAALKRAQANLSIAQFTAANATEQAERYTTLIKRGVASKEQFSQYIATAESQKSELDARRADVDEAQLSLDWTQIKSPVTGRAGAALLKAGNIVQANTDVLTVINQMQPIYVAFPLPEGSLNDVREWMAKSKPAVFVREPDSGELLGTGELAFIDNAVDRTSGMISYKATFLNEDEKLWPGQFVDVTLRLAEQSDALVIPSTAIMEGQEGPQVFVVNGDKAELRKVQVERTAGDLSLIKEGLKEGEHVVITGQLRVSNGAKVLSKSAPAPQEAPQS